jgi:hypothetical protein
LRENGRLKLATEAGRGMASCITDVFSDAEDEVVAVEVGVDEENEDVITEARSCFLISDRVGRVG